MRLALVACRSTPTNDALSRAPVDGQAWEPMTPQRALGEWRTNVALGGARRQVLEPPRKAVELALAAARSVGAALVGVDLLPTSRGDWVVAELNGAVEFTHEYAPYGDVFAETTLALTREIHARSELRAALASPTAA